MLNIDVPPPPGEMMTVHRPGTARVTLGVILLLIRLLMLLLVDIWLLLLLLLLLLLVDIWLLLIKLLLVLLLIGLLVLRELVRLVKPHVTWKANGRCTLDLTWNNIREDIAVS